MLSYLHGYHAGNFADVHKHLLLGRVLAALARKPAPFAVLDVHAGEGLYDLNGPEARALGEADGGIRRFMDLPGPPAAADAYRAVIARFNSGAGVSLYPGSPLIAREAMRENDRLVLVDLHPRAEAALRRLFAGDGCVHIHRRDALEALVGLVPPPERRGLAVVDPAYEVKDEYRTVPLAVERAFRRWGTGHFLVWYPLLPEGRHEALVEALTAGPYPGLLFSEWRHRPCGAVRGLYGSGVALVNPPWGVAEEAEVLGRWLEAGGFGEGYRQWGRPT